MNDKRTKCDIGMFYLMQGGWGMEYKATEEAEAGPIAAFKRENELAGLVAEEELDLECSDIKLV